MKCVHLRPHISKNYVLGKGKNGRAKTRAVGERGDSLAGDSP